MRIILICLALLIGAQAQAAEDDMVEFCGAILIVVQDSQSFALWKARYSLDMVTVLKYQLSLQEQLDSGYIKDIELSDAAEGCRDASAEEMIADE